MGGAYSLKRYQHDDYNISRRGFSSRHFKFGSSNCLQSFLLERVVDCHPRESNSPTLMELCIHKIRKDIDKYQSFSMLPRDISQLTFNNLVYSNCLSENCIEAFRDCALHDMWMGEYKGVKDNWIDVVSSQGSSLLSVYIVGPEVTDFGFSPLQNCSNLQALSFDCCDRISEQGIKQVSGFSNLTYLSFRKCVSVTAEAMQALSSLDKLVKLDFERCPQIHGGLVHLQGLSKLESLSIRCCQCITDSDMKPLAALASLKKLQILCIYVTDYGVSYLRGLNNLVVLNMEGSHVTTLCLDTVSDLASLQSLNLSRCCLRDDGCEKFSALNNLKVLNLGYNHITDACLGYLEDLTKLEGLNLDSCRIRDDGLSHLAVKWKICGLQDSEFGENSSSMLSAMLLEFSENIAECVSDPPKVVYFFLEDPTRVRHHFGESTGHNLSVLFSYGLAKLEELNLKFTLVTDDGLQKLTGLSRLKSLNLDVRQITDSGLAVLTGFTGLTHLDLFGSHITDSGTKYLAYFRNLQSLDLCGGALSDAGVENIKDISSLMFLNLSQNRNLTDKTLELLSGLILLVWLNVSNSCITNDGLRQLKPLKNLRSLDLEYCNVTASEIQKLQANILPNLVTYRPN